MRIAAFVVFLAGASPALAQPDPKQEAAKLFEDGRTLAKDGKWEAACAVFQKSFALDPAIGTELNLGDCEEHLSRNAEAWRHFDHAAAQSAGTDNAERTKYARERAAAAATKLGTVIVKLADPLHAGLQVSIAGRTVPPAAQIKELVDPGTIEVQVTAPDRLPVTRKKAVTAGATVEVVVDEPTATTTTTAPTAPLTETPPATGERAHGRVVIAYAIGGIGAAAVVASLGLGLKARGDYNSAVSSVHCMHVGSQLQCDNTGFTAVNDAGSLADIATGVGIVGLAAVGVGAVLSFTAPREVVVAPTATASSAGVSISGHF